MKLSVTRAEPTQFTCDLLVIGRYQDEAPSAAEATLDGALGGALTAAAERLRFKGQSRKKVALDTAGRVGAARVLVLGLGKRDEAGPAALRDHAALAVDEALALRMPVVGLVPPDADDAAAQLALGALLGAYRFDQLKSEKEDEPRPRVESVTLLADAAAEAGVRRAEIIAGSINRARTLVNEPANICTPERLAEFARGLAKHPGVEVTVLDEDEIRARGMGGLLAVSQAATQPPRFIHVKYTPQKAGTGAPLVLVGKGLTFDSGGLSIKTGKGMVDMYMDMAGSAAVLGTMDAVAQLQPDVAVHGIVGACENMIGGNSFRPSDVLKMYSGKTVEVLNTDAEGRLVLADALHYAAQLKPRAIIDLATLTGACMVGLGNFTAGLFSDDDALADEVAQAAKQAGEKVWRLPLDPKLAETLESKRADVTNLGGSWGGAITAAQFLQHFKGDARWAHLDIAGPAMAEKDDGYVRAGGTGFGVLTLLQLIEGAR